jgi:hypothetical protein
LGLLAGLVEVLQEAWLLVRGVFLPRYKMWLSVLS